MGNAQADRNLLFGILALQMDFIDRDDLVEALNAWVLDKERPLERILHDRGALDPEALAALESVVALHLRRHGGDPSQSLAALASNATAREAVGSLDDPDVRASLALALGSTVDHEPAVAATMDHTWGRASVHVAAGTPTSAGRFRILRPHARGGLGEVFVARDEELGRQVALKEILPEKQANPNLRGRFVLEAEINGNLEHPGIVPVYGLGTYPDGRPFYAMRFIRGESLKQAIAAFHREATTLDPAAYNLRLRELLDRFVAVCHAIAYAHSRGVLHRDLKPANVMLGPFGETLVVDWGLAKVTGHRDTEGDGAAKATLVPSFGVVEPTVAGAALGTPGYMSPEQAEGRLDNLGPATDVYGLGAILYALLTGRAPITGADTGEILAKTLRGAIDPPRAVAPHVPPALAAICLKALATRPEDRYGGARALAEDLRRWQADEPVSAYREPLPVRLGRWTRRHRTLVTTAASVFLVLATVGVGLGLWLAEQHRGRMVRLERFHANAASQEALALEEPTSVDRWNTALAAARQAAEAVGEDAASGPGRRILGLTERVEASARDAEADRALLSELTAVRTALSDLGTSGVDSGYAAAFAAYGLDLDATPPSEAAERLRRRPEAFRAEVAAMLDDWISIRRSLKADVSRIGPLATLAIALDPDPQRGRLRRLLLEPDLTARIEELRGLASGDRIATTAAPTAVLLARSLFEAGERNAAIAVLQDAATRHPRDVWANYHLAVAYDRASPRRAEEAIPFYTAARVLRPETAHALAHLMAEHGRRSDATIIFSDLVRLRPEDPRFLGCYGGHLKELGRHDEAAPWLDRAIAAHREAIRLDPDDAVVHTNLGLALSHSGDLPGAIAAHREAIRLDPENAGAYNNLGMALRASGDLPGAIAAYREAIRFDPGFPGIRHNLGMALRASGDLPGAVAAYREAIRLDPGFAGAYTNLGNTLRVSRDLPGAIAAHREAIRLDPDDAVFQSNFGMALGDSGDLAGAIAAFREAIRLDPDLAASHSNLGMALRASGDLSGAIAAYREAIRLDPDLARPYYNLGNVLSDSGDLAGAVAAFREAIRLDPDDAEAYCNLGHVLMSQGRFAEALAVLEMGHEIGSARPGWPYPSARWVEESRRMVALEARLAAVLAGEAEPADPVERAGLAMTAYRKRLYAAAARLFSEAFAERPALADDLGAGHRYNAACSAALAAAGKGEEDSPPNSEERARWPRQALDWLRADLEAWTKSLEADSTQVRTRIVSTLRHWRTDPDLAAIRDEAALAALPEADRDACRALWADVAALLKRAESPD